MSLNPRNGRPFPLWQLGFRPFFLFGALHSAAAILLWLLYLRGRWNLPGHFDPITWHAHEMLYGFTGAIIAGFLLTASQNWTGIRGVHGRPLQLLVGIWILARVLALVPGVPLAFAIVDISFWPLLSWLMIPYFRQPKQKNNRVFFLFFGLFGFSNLILHAEALGLVSGLARPAMMTGLYTILLVIGLIGGRVLPFFTSFVLPDFKPNPRPWLEKATHGITVAFFLSLLFFELSVSSAILGTAAALAHLLRWWGWQRVGSFRSPILLVLHVGYLFLPLGYGMKSLAALGLVAPTLATHTLTVGALGLIVFGMITRVSLGHTGQKVVASPPISAAYLALTLAAFLRFLAPWVYPGLTGLWWDASGALWILSYGIFVGVLGKWLISPRPDGKPG